MNPRAVILLLCAFGCVSDAFHRIAMQRHRQRKLPHARHLWASRKHIRRKFGVTAAAAPQSGGSSTNSAPSEAIEPLFNAYETQFYGPCLVGNQPFTLQFDTGSSDLWIPNANCTTCAKTCDNSVFQAAKSKSFVANGTAFKITYGIGEVSGVLATDTVSIGQISIKNQGFGLVSQTDTCSSFDGVLGLAYPAVALTRQKPPFYQMIEQKLVDQPIFSFHLKSNTTDGGSLILGGSNSSLYHGSLTHVNVTEQKLWKFTMDYIGFPSRKCRRCNGCNAIMDSGTSLLVGPTEDITQLNRKIGAKYNTTNGLWEVQCARIKYLPVLELGIAGKKFHVRPQEYIIAYEDNVCITGFMDLAGINFWIIGDVFFREHYLLFDVEQNRIGIAVAK
ncbi:cathepsin D [Drosophila guanche]|uniref:Blast:Cathepsin D n=1 Tax=Drosophila guanche TaxID=7266 RepID=A0A3B0JGX1_DROGU|nr:cathepsin D [Drosophila guanche]SPP79963.1 blast:Cathepsin D [Drosophila guanche]